MAPSGWLSAAERKDQTPRPLGPSGVDAIAARMRKDDVGAPLMRPAPHIRVAWPVRVESWSGTSFHVGATDRYGKRSTIRKVRNRDVGRASNRPRQQPQKLDPPAI